MVNRFSGIAIRSLACALPKQSVSLEQFQNRFQPEKIERFREIVGIEKLHIASEGMRTSDLAVAAANLIFDDRTIARDEIDVLLFISQTPDAIAPATSALLQKRLGLPSHLLALDINQGCAGFLTGMQTAAHLLASPAIRNVLILGGDTLTRLVNSDDPATAMLFGDAGFAAIIGRDSTSSEWLLTSGIESSTAITIPHKSSFTMSGTEVFNFSITKVPEQILQLMRTAKLTPSSLDYLLLHQANAFILRQIARMCHLQESKVPCRIAPYGNTSVASLPLLLCELYSEGIRGNKHVIFSAFGVGLTWISTALTFNFDSCHAPILLETLTQ